MKQIEKVQDCYNKAAASYHQQFGQEIANKPLDQILLREFANEYSPKGALIDLGCGPGQTTRFLYDHGVQDLTGIDLSEAMVEVAQSEHPEVNFKQGNMLNLDLENDSTAAAVSFYGIVHFDYAELESVFQEVQRVLQPGGGYLFSFHVGDESVHTLDFLGHSVNVRFNFFDPDRIRGILLFQGWEIRDAILRYPYEGKELPNRRAYFWVVKPNA